MEKYRMYISFVVGEKDDQKEGTFFVDVNLNGKIITAPITAIDNNSLDKLSEDTCKVIQAMCKGAKEEFE